MGDERWQLIGLRKERCRVEGDSLCSLTEACARMRCVCTQIGPWVADLYRDDWNPWLGVCTARICLSKINVCSA